MYKLIFHLKRLYFAILKDKSVIIFFNFDIFYFSKLFIGFTVLFLTFEEKLFFFLFTVSKQ